jgi:hypothetical protein
MIIEKTKVTLSEKDMEDLVSDAARYSWLRDHHANYLHSIPNYDSDDMDCGTEHIQSILFCNGNGYASEINGEELDEAIDDAILKSMRIMQ